MSELFLHGYPVDHGADRPDPDWPGGARLAVQLSVLAPDPVPSPDPSIGSSADALEQQLERDRRAGAAHRRDRAFGARVGLERLRLLLRRYSVPATWFLAPSLAERRQPLVRTLVADGDEIAILGRIGDPIDVAGQVARIAAAAGAEPWGWRSIRRHPDGRGALAAAGLAYDADAADDDLPRWVVAAGRGMLVLPATPLADRRRDTLSAMLAFVCDEAAVRPQMLRLELRADRDGRPDAAAGVAAFLASLADRPDLWIAPAMAIAAHWRDRHPFAWD